MEFDRRTRQGKASTAAEMKEPVGAGNEGVVEIDEVSVEGGGSKLSEGESGLPSLQDEKGEDSPATASYSPSEEVREHNLAKAMALAQRGDELGAALVPLRLASIRIEGARNVRPSFLTRLCRPYVDAQLTSESTVNRLLYAHRLQQVKPGQSSSLPGLLSLLASIGTDVGSLDVFSSTSASLEPSRVQPEALFAAASRASSSLHEDVDVVLRCKEKSRFFAKSSTEVGNGEGMAAIQTTVRNVFGGAETADVSATIGTRTRKAFHASLSSPLFALPDHTITLSAFAQDRDLTSYASAFEGARGARIAFRYVYPGTSFGLAGGVHELAYDLCHRHLARLTPAASLGMRRLAGHSVKSSISHTFTLDDRDAVGMDVVTSSFPAQGALYKSTLEYAGLGGDANHLKCEVEGQQVRCFGEQDEFGMSFTARLGALLSLNGRPPAFSDRFQLGGPTSVRMFRYHSLGPKDSLDSLGGEAYTSVGASALAPFWPGKAHWPFKWHAFLNGGQLVQLDHDAGFGVGHWARSNGGILCHELLGKPSCSAGVGLIFRQGALRAELNVGVPLSMKKGDGARKGIQLGIGVDFL